MTMNKTVNQRSVRLNKIVCNEFNYIFHTVFKEETSKITVTHVSVSPDMRDAYVYFSVVGTEADIESAKKFLKKNSKVIRQRVFQRVQIKFSPRLTFRYDPSIEQGHHILEILDELEKSG